MGEFDKATVTRIMGHMNKDHKISLLAYAWFLLGQQDAASAELVGLSPTDLTLAVTSDGGKKSAVQLPFDKTIAQSQLKDVLIQLHKDALSYVIPPDKFISFFVNSGLFVLLPLVAYPSLDAYYAKSSVDVVYTAIKMVREDFAMKVLGMSLESVHKLFVFALGLHVVESLVGVLATRSYLEMKDIKVLIWRFISGFCFGVFSVRWLFKLKSAKELFEKKD